MRNLQNIDAPQSARVILVGYEDQDNLGVRYLISRLREAGHRAEIMNIGTNRDELIETIVVADADLIGFSLIFQYLVPEYSSLLEDLRRRGVTAHFTIGGHFASFEYSALLDTMPALDSVVRFEGEDTVVELAENLVRNRPWRKTRGIAYRAGPSVKTNAARPGRQNLDELPWPTRDDIRYERQGLPTASVLGSRGCPWQCSFCSIITFYEENGTKGRRRRDPSAVVDELEFLHRERGVEVILWQDDDFLAGGLAAKRWAESIAAECVARGLHHGLRWKFSCRSNEVRRETIEPLVAAGLTHIYLGIEAGDPRNLQHLNKLMSPDAHFAALEVIREFDLSFDFGFMLLNPWSTIDTVRGNLGFLREFAGAGDSVAGFCRMLPYVGTAAERRLRDEGRLLSHDLRADYAFLDTRLDSYYAWLLETFNARNTQANGTLNLLRLLQFEAHLRLPMRSPDSRYRDVLRCLVALDNMNAIEILSEALDYFEQVDDAASDHLRLDALKRRQTQHDALLRIDLAGLLEQRPDCEALVHATR